MATKIPAVFGLNQFLWSKLSAKKDAQGNDITPVLDINNYAGLIPIIPVQEEPELLNAIAGQPGVSTAPYIIYTYYNNGVDQTWWETYDQIIYVINSLDQGKLREINLLIQKYFKRYDESARLVNDYIWTTYPLPTGVTEDQDGPGVAGYDYRAYTYKYIQVFASTGGAPVNADNEPIKATVTVRVCYTNKNNDNALS